MIQLYCHFNFSFNWLKTCNRYLQSIHLLEQKHNNNVYIHTAKALINARAFIRIVTFHIEGVGAYKRLEF